ncbi:Serine/threonine protein kinase [Handroanthus impetiginosus]|uniref:Serine/threonine protein kinase n=1 Tax=Handroanthus impetiginosus TaxID=429701 RepID=A0A2G9GYS4_9LAMI|nr:Serine/threonine protein kinase [Handroanthus impetiginosus]
MNREITGISLDGQLRALQFIAHDRYNRNRMRVSYNNPWINLPISLTVNNTANKFTTIGCDAYSFISGRRLNRNYTTGCTAMCDVGDLIGGSCTGLGCCQTSIPKQVWRVESTLRSYQNYSNVWSFYNCSYAFLEEESAFRFSSENLTNLRNVEKLPMVIDWASGNSTCEEAQMNASSYACKSINSKCYKPNNGYGYRCACLEGYKGNPYLTDSCQVPVSEIRDEIKENITRRKRSSDTTMIFSESELQKAMNNFHTNIIIGQGGFGTVYKSFLPDNRVIAFKKSKEVDPNQIKQVINEVIILSQINHRNVVKLLGCCLETHVPLLVHEFINNGTHFEHIHKTANVLAYLHSATSTPIIHGDVKSANILLDDTLIMKVSNFGASGLVLLDQTQLSTMVHGTFRYLNPEYMQTNQLTEKSAIYNFGVVLVELLTGKKALSCGRLEEERNLANLFLLVMKQERLFKILEDNVVRERNNEQLMKVAMVAKSCLYVKGDDRPSMKEVSRELEGLRLGEKHPWNQTEPSGEDTELLLGAGFNGFINATECNSINVGFDSVKDRVMLPMGEGR